MFLYADRVLAAQHRLTISLCYLAGAVIAGTTAFDPDQLSGFARPYWTDAMHAA